MVLSCTSEALCCTVMVRVLMIYTCMTAADISKPSTNEIISSIRVNPDSLTKQRLSRRSINNESQPALSKDAQRKLAAEQRKLTAPIRRDIENTEKALADIDKKLTTLETKLADTEFYEESRKSDLMKLLNEQTALQQQHSQHEEKLLLAMTTLEEMEANIG